MWHDFTLLQHSGTHFQKKLDSLSHSLPLTQYLKLTFLQYDTDLCVCVCVCVCVCDEQVISASLNAFVGLVNFVIVNAVNNWKALRTPMKKGVL